MGRLRPRGFWLGGSATIKQALETQGRSPNKLVLTYIQRFLSIIRCVVDIVRYRTISSDILCGRRFVAIIPDDLPPSTGIVDIMEEVAAFHQAFPQYATSGGRMQVLLPRPPVWRTSNKQARKKFFSLP